MGFDLNALERAVTEHGRVARVVITGIQGSSPREIGASIPINFPIFPIELAYFSH